MWNTSLVGISFRGGFLFFFYRVHALNDIVLRFTFVTLLIDHVGLLKLSEKKKGKEFRNNAFLRKFTKNEK